MKHGEQSKLVRKRLSYQERLASNNISCAVVTPRVKIGTEKEERHAMRVRTATEGNNRQEGQYEVAKTENRYTRK